jgi:hypothetical protein
MVCPRRLCLFSCNQELGGGPAGAPTSKPQFAGDPLGTDDDERRHSRLQRCFVTTIFHRVWSRKNATSVALVERQRRVHLLLRLHLVFLILEQRFNYHTPTVAAVNHRAGDLSGEDRIVELCRERINQNLYYRRSQEFLEIGKKWLAGDTACEAISDEVNCALRPASSRRAWPRF